MEPVASGSYPIEIEKIFPGVNVFQEACPMWVPLVENNEHRAMAGFLREEKSVSYFLKRNPELM
jgi:glutamate racemase